MTEYKRCNCLTYPKQGKCNNCGRYWLVYNDYFLTDGQGTMIRMRESKQQYGFCPYSMIKGD